MTTRSMILSCLLILLSACGEGSPVGPDKLCNQGSVTLGAARTGSVTASDCSFSVASRAQGRYDAYSVALVRGRVYQVRLDASEPDSLDTFVEVVEPGGNGIALSNDNWFSNRSEVFFIAPASGTYSVRAGGKNAVDRGNYTLSMRECAATTINSTATVSGALAATDCMTRYSFSANGNFSDVFLITLTGVRQKVTAVSSVATLLFMVSGPDFASLDADQKSTSMSMPGSAGTLFIWDSSPGTYLIIVSAREKIVKDRAYTIQMAPLYPPTSARREAAHPSSEKPLVTRREE